MDSVYSFQDIYISLNHPGVGNFSAAGEGLGDLTIAYANDNTVHDVAADGSVMISKVIANNGTATINTQQVSALNSYLRRWNRHLKTAASSEWARMTITIRDLCNGETILLEGVSPQKPGDMPYQAQGQRVSWTLMAAKISG